MWFITSSLDSIHGNVITLPVSGFSTDTWAIYKQWDMRRNSLVGLWGNAFLFLKKNKEKKRKAHLKNIGNN